jgi:hypothetical protein
MVIELPEASMSPVAVLYWETPCWLVTLPVLDTCWVVGHALTLLPLLLKLDDGEAEPLVILFSENFWPTPEGSTEGSELLNLGPEGSELLLKLGLEESELLKLGLEGSELLKLGALEEGLMALSVIVGLSGDDNPTAVDKGVTKLSVTNPTGLAKGLPGAATAGITKAAANKTTNPTTMMIRRTISSFARNA